MEEVCEFCWYWRKFEEHGREERPYAANDESDANGDKDGTSTTGEPVSRTLDSAKGRVDDFCDGFHDGQCCQCSLRTRCDSRSYKCDPDQIK